MIFALNLARNLLKVRQCIGNVSIDLGENNSIEFIQNIFWFASSEEPAIHGTNRDAFPAQPSAAAECFRSLNDELADFHRFSLPRSTRSFKVVWGSLFPSVCLSYLLFNGMGKV